MGSSPSPKLIAMSTNGSHRTPHIAQPACVVLVAAVVGTPASQPGTRTLLALVPAWCDASLAWLDRATVAADRAGRWCLWMVAAARLMCEARVGTAAASDVTLGCCPCSVAGPASSHGARAGTAVEASGGLAPHVPGCCAQASRIAWHAFSLFMQSSSLATRSSVCTQGCSLFPRSRLLLLRSRGLSLRTSGRSPCTSGDVLHGRLLVPEDRPDVARDRSLFLRTSGLSWRLLPGCRTSVQKYNASEDDRHAEEIDLRAVVLSDVPVVFSLGADAPEFGAMLRACAVAGRMRGTVRDDPRAIVRGRSMHRRKRTVFASARRYANASHTALWLAYVGAQTGHDRAQSCPSKHPDGYREVPF